MFPARNVPHGLARLRVGQSRPIILFALVTLGVVVGPAIATAAQLDLTWVDNSGGQAAVIIQRSTGSTGTFTQIAQAPLGSTSYSDTTVTLGTIYCYQVAAVDSAGVSAFSNLACSSLSGGGFTITAADGGTGTGTIVSSPTGINCGTSCSATYPSGATVTLAATPASGSSFSGWSGSYCSGTSPCSVAGAGSVTVSAMSAALGSYILTVSEQGSGSVSSSPGGINCGTACSATYPSGTAVTLTATPASGSTFSGWSGGGCSGTSACTLAGNGSVTVTATFASTVSTDTTRPNATIASPKNNSFVKGSTSVSVSASDNIAVAKVQLYVDKALSAEAKTAPYAFTWDTTQAAQGPHILTAIAYDTAGNSRTSNPVAVTGDNTPPVIGPVSVATVGTHLNVAMSVTDNIKVAKVVLYVDGQLIATDTSTPYSFSIDLKHFALRPHALEVRAYDPSGNVASSGQMAFTR